MLREPADVLATARGRALVRTRRAEGCSRCAAGGGCSHLGSGREATVWAVDPLGVAVGDRVEVAVPEGAALKASALLTVLPALALLGGAALGHHLAPAWGIDRDLGAATLGVVALSVALAAARWAGNRPGHQPRVVQKA